MSKRLRAGDLAGIIALVVLAIVGLGALIGIGLGSLTGSPFVTGVLAFLVPVGFAYGFYQPKGFSLYLGFSGLVSYFAASATFGALTGGFTAYLAATVVAFAAFAVVVFLGMTLFNKRFGDTSWRSKD